MSRPGFVVGQDIPTGAKVGIAVRLIVTYDEGTDLAKYEQEIQRAIVAVAPAAYVELEKRAG
ncbi:hypothetical protein SEA_OTTAWA_94 [Arthrobacter phage Ottawa]|nr:hypothetical protein SEA_KHARCHO_94 [Arthrobacter phage Kharcho]WIC89326.1 hypothetical protein SEA_OTTAWA_94 [Arthrobacter phage Ottawa]